jgi:CHAT domain-containing protein
MNPISLSVIQRFNCPHCNEPLVCEIWLIVDTAERPDLLKRLRDGSLYSFTCPNCQTVSQVAAPLLIYRRGEIPALIFSPGQRSTNEQNRDDVIQLLNSLRQRLDNTQWHIIRDEVPRLIPRSRLGEVLNAAPPPKQQFELLIGLIQQFVVSPTWDEAYRYLEAHPELLSDEADTVWHEMTALFGRGGNRRSREALKEHYDLLCRCKEIGVKEAFAEKIGVSPEEIVSRPALPSQAITEFLQALSWPALYDYLNAHPELLSEEVEAKLTRVIADADKLQEQLSTDDNAWIRQLSSRVRTADVVPHLVARRDLLRRCREVGIEQAFAEKMQVPLDGLKEVSSQALFPLQSIFEFIGAPTWTASYHYVKTHPGLLSSNTEAHLERVIDDFDDLWQRLLADRSVMLGLVIPNTGEEGRVSALQSLKEHRDLLRRCREVGVEQAFAEKMQVPLEKFERDVYDAVVYELPTDLQASARTAIDNWESYRISHSRSTLEAAVRAWESILAHPSFALLPGLTQRIVLNYAAMTFFSRYKALGDLHDLNQAIRLWRESIQQAPPDSPDLPALLNNLGDGLYECYKRTGRQADLEQSLESYRRALQQTTTDSSRAKLLNNMGISLRAHYRFTGDIQSLEQAIHAYQRAIDLTASDSPDLPARLSNLGNALMDRYQQMGQITDMDQAIEVHQKAVYGVTAASPEQPGYLGNLAVSLLARYERTAQLQDIERALQASLRAVQATPAEAPDFPGYLSNLGQSLQIRYRRLGRLEDLNQAVKAYQQVVQRMSPNSPYFPGELRNLATSLANRYAVTGNREDLEQAIQISQRAIQLTPPGSPNLPGHLHSLGVGLLVRYRHSRRHEYLDLAITTFRQALLLVPEDSPDLPRYLEAMSEGLLARYQKTKQQEDLEEAINLSQKAIRRAQEGSSIRLICLRELSRGLRHRYDHTLQQQDLDRAVASYEEICRQGMPLNSSITLRSAVEWGDWARERLNWNEAARAYTYAVQVFEQLYHFQLSQTSQENWLSQVRSLHNLAAYALAHAGHLEEALVLLEQGRARGLSETLARDQADLDLVRQRAPEVYDRYQKAVELLRQFERADREESLASLERHNVAANTSALEQRRQAHEKLEKALADIRSLPGYETFLRTLTHHDILRVTRPDVPFAYLVTTSAGSLVLLIHTGNTKPEVIWIDDLTEASLNELLVKRDGDAVVGGYLPGQLFRPQWLNEALLTVSSLLGTSLIAPIAGRLHELGARGLVLFPTGLLSLLPLHAVYYRMNGQDTCLLDEFDVSYAPSARVLDSVQREAQKRQNYLPQTVGIGNPLPGIRMGMQVQNELQHIIPTLQHAIEPLLRQLEKDAETSTEEGHQHIADFMHLCERTFLDLQSLCQLPSEDVIRAGRILLHAARIFAFLPGIRKDIVVALDRLSAYIPPSLTYAHAELENIQALLPGEAVITFYGQEATERVFWNALPRTTNIHFACHGSFDAEDPLDSALLLAEEGHLTLRKLLNADPQVMANLRLVFLSACQTAVIDFWRLPDEATGLLSGFLRAGVPSVVGTLWSVNDQSTALLVTRFYELYLQGEEQTGLPPQPAVSALRRAQRWMRGLTNNALLAYLKEREDTHSFSPGLLKELLPATRQAVHRGRGDEFPYVDPYHWAAFVYYGVL